MNFGTINHSIIQSFNHSISNNIFEDQTDGVNDVDRAQMGYENSSDASEAGKIRSMLTSVQIEANDQLEKEIKEAVEKKNGGGDDPKDSKKPSTPTPTPPLPSKAPYLVYMPVMAVENTGVANNSKLKWELNDRKIEKFESKLAELQKSRNAAFFRVPGTDALKLDVFDVARARTAGVQDIARNYYKLPDGTPLSKIQIAEFDYQAKLEDLIFQSYGVTKTQQRLTRHIGEQVTRCQSLNPSDQKTYAEVMTALNWRALEYANDSRIVGKRDNSAEVQGNLEKNRTLVDIYRKSRHPVIVQAVADFDKTDSYKRQLGADKHNEVVNSFVMRAQGVLGLACAYGQIVTGYGMSATGVGSIAGVPLMALGADNAQKAWGQLCGAPNASSVTGDALFIAMSAAGRPIKRERCEEIVQMGSDATSGLIGLAGALKSGSSFAFLISADALQGCATGKEITTTLMKNAVMKYGNFSETDAQALATSYFVLAQSKSVVQGAHQVKMAYDAKTKRFVDGHPDIINKDATELNQLHVTVKNKPQLKIKDRDSDKALAVAGLGTQHTKVDKNQYKLSHNTQTPSDKMSNPTQGKVIALNGSGATPTPPSTSIPEAQAGTAKIITMNTHGKVYVATGTDGIASSSTSKSTAFQVVRMETGTGVGTTGETTVSPILTASSKPSTSAVVKGVHSDESHSAVVENINNISNFTPDAIQLANFNLINNAILKNPNLKYSEILKLVKNDLIIANPPYGFTKDSFSDAKLLIRDYLKKNNIELISGYVTGSRVLGVSGNCGTKAYKFGKFKENWNDSDLDVTLVTSKKLSNRITENLCKEFKREFGIELGVAVILDVRQLAHKPVAGKIDL